MFVITFLIAITPKFLLQWIGYFYCFNLLLQFAIIIYYSIQSYDNDNNYKLLGFAHELRTFIGQGR